MVIKRGRPRNFDREEALRRAMMLFWAQGYDGTSLSDLARVMELNPPSIYAAFDSKERLFCEAVALYQATEGGNIWGSMVLPAVREAVATLLQASAVEFTQPGKPCGCLVVLGALFADSSSETVHKALQECRAESMGRLVLRLKQGVAEGELMDGPDWEAVAAFFMAVQQGMSILARDGASRQVLLAVAEGAMAAWDTLVGVEDISRQR